MFKLQFEEFMLKPVPEENTLGPSFKPLPAAVGGWKPLTVPTVTVGILLLANSASPAAPGPPGLPGGPGGRAAQPAALALELPPLPERSFAGIPSSLLVEERLEQVAPLPATATSASIPGAMKSKIPGDVAMPVAPAMPNSPKAAVGSQLDPSSAEAAPAGKRTRARPKKAALAKAISGHLAKAIGGRPVDANGRMIFEVESQDPHVVAVLENQAGREFYSPVVASRAARKEVSAQLDGQARAQPAQANDAEITAMTAMEESNPDNGSNSVAPFGSSESDAGGRSSAGRQYASIPSASDAPPISTPDPGFPGDPLSARPRDPNSYEALQANRQPVQIVPLKPPAAGRGQDFETTAARQGGMQKPAAPGPAVMPAISSLDDLYDALQQDQARFVVLTGSASEANMPRELALKIADSRVSALKRELVAKGIVESRIKTATPVIGQDGVSFKICGSVCS